ncbi:unnamed protein product [Rotaria sp. Silwood1]|nr:unnamed protein product [Rotaria sp. Silwood1]CAF1092082.1 unnamed protein product [Rotaria sp. Silwood1]CAF1097670.1 unnamed protein product [Rotaria sp. Silwood1]
MNNLSRYYDASFKQRVIEYYLQNQPNLSFRFVAKFFHIHGDHATVKRWFDRYDGTILSLQQQMRSGRPQILNQEEIDQFITRVICSHNRMSRSIKYSKIMDLIHQKTKLNISTRTVQRYGKKNGIKSRKMIKRTAKEISSASSESIAKLRRKLQRISNKKIIFLDETHIKINEAPRTTLVAPGENPYVIVTDSSSYAARYDMIAAVVGDQILPSIIYSPADRKTKNVKGINSNMLIDFIENILCPSISTLDYCPIYSVLDKSHIHNISKIKEALGNFECMKSVEILVMPTQAAKRISPLENSLFHEWKERVRQHSSLSEETLATTMTNEWFNTRTDNIKHYYDHCGITYGQDMYTYSTRSLLSIDKKKFNYVG